LLSLFEGEIGTCALAFFRNGLVGFVMTDQQPAVAANLTVTGDLTRETPTIAPLMHPLAWAAEERKSPRTAVKKISFSSKVRPDHDSKGTEGYGFERTMRSAARMNEPWNLRSHQDVSLLKHGAFVFKPPVSIGART